jgi:peptide deformylase
MIGRKKIPKLLQIAQLGHPVLRQKAKPVKDIHDPYIQKLIDDLLATLSDIDGMGLAAPQVYESYRVFIIASHPSPRYPNAPEIEPTAIINPKIIRYSEEMDNEWEGCLSIPGLRGLVPRNKTIVVKYTTRHGKSVKTEFDDFVARIFQHEYDHLDGLVYLDSIKSTKNIITDKEFQKLIAKK